MKNIPSVTSRFKATLKGAQLEPEKKVSDKSLAEDTGSPRRKRRRTNVDRALEEAYLIYPAHLEPVSAPVYCYRPNRLLVRSELHRIESGGIDFRPDRLSNEGMT